MSEQVATCGACGVLAVRQSLGLPGRPDRIVYTCDWCGATRSVDRIAGDGIHAGAAKLKPVGVTTPDYPVRPGELYAVAVERKILECMALSGCTHEEIEQAWRRGGTLDHMAKALKAGYVNKADLCELAISWRKKAVAAELAGVIARGGIVFTSGQSLLMVTGIGESA